MGGSTLRTMEPWSQKLLVINKETSTGFIGPVACKRQHSCGKYHKYVAVVGIRYPEALPHPVTHNYHSGNNSYMASSGNAKIENAVYTANACLPCCSKVKKAVPASLSKIQCIIVLFSKFL